MMQEKQISEMHKTLWQNLIVKFPNCAVYNILCFHFISCFPPFRESYLFNQTSWVVCVRPQHVVMWNVVLFSILLSIGTLEAVLLLAQVVNGLIGCLCGACMNKNQVCLL